MTVGADRLLFANDHAHVLRDVNNLSMFQSGVVNSFRDRRRSRPSAHTIHGPAGPTRRERTVPRSAHLRSLSSGSHCPPALKARSEVAEKRSAETQIEQQAKLANASKTGEAKDR